MQGYNLLKLEDIGMWKLVSTREAFFAFFSVSIGIFNVSFFNVLLTLHLRDDFHVKTNEMGFYFAIVSSPYMISSILFPMIFKNTPRKLWFIICFFSSAFGFMLMGPSMLLGFEDSKTLLMIGLFIIGMMQALVFIPSFPEAIDSHLQKYKIIPKYDLELDNKMNDTLGSLFALAYNFSGLVSPILGGFIYVHFAKGDTKAYRKTMDSVMIFNFAMGVIYLLFNCGNVYKNAEIQKQELAQMAEITQKIVEIDKKQNEKVESQT